MSKITKDKPQLVLHKLDASPPACAVMMLADLLGLEFEYKEPDFLQLEHKSSEYKKLNPMGTIPMLQDGDFIISESHSAMKYLLSVYGSADIQEQLYPSDPKARALVDQCLFFDAGVMFIRIREVTLPSIFEGLKSPTQKNISSIEDAYGVLEAYLTRKYIAADHLTIADLSLGSTTNSLQGIHRLDEQKFPRVAKWLNLVNEEPCFKKISIRGAALLAELIHSYWKKE